jgi:hypothetical protein
MQISRHLSDKPQSFIEANKSPTFSDVNSQSTSATGLPNLTTALVTAEEFQARMVAGLHADEQLWCMNQNLYPGMMDWNLEMLANGLHKRSLRLHGI